MCKDSPSQQVGMLIDELLWPGHPLGTGYRRIQRDCQRHRPRSSAEFHEFQIYPSQYPDRCDRQRRRGSVLETVEKLLGGWSNTCPAPGLCRFKEGAGPRLKIEKRDTEQAHLCLALPGISLLHPQRFHLDLLNVILGEGMSSRLFAEIRDKMGLAYSISSYVEHFLDSGSLTVAASVDPSNLNKAVKAIMEQLHLLKEEIPEAEMHKAREISKGRLMLRMEDSRNVAGWLGGQEMLTGTHPDSGGGGSDY